MSAKSPFDPAEMMKMFNPQNMQNMFDPEQFKAFFAPMQQGAFDMTALMEANQRNVEAVIAANKAAAETNKKIYEQQMAIFQRMMTAAQEYAQSHTQTLGDDFAGQQAKVYGEAMEKSLAMMTEMAEAARKANEEAFANMQSQIEEAVETIRKMPPGQS